jgi:hypothetical protein
MESFLSTPPIPPLTDAAVINLTFLNSAALTLKHLSLIKKNRPPLGSYTPSDIHNFVPEYAAYHRYRGTFSMALCLTTTQLYHIHQLDTPPKNPLDADVKEQLERRLPVKIHVHFKEHCRGKVSMRYRRELKYVDQFCST